MDAFLGTTDRLSEDPCEVVALAASALLAISFMRGDDPERIKRGLPVFKHHITLGKSGLNIVTNVKPQPSHFLTVEDPDQRIVAAGLPASLNYHERYYGDVAVSFERRSAVVAVEFGGKGYSSVTEAGRDTIRDVWQIMHKSTIAYVDQAAEQLV